MACSCRDCELALYFLCLRFFLLTNSLNFCSDFFFRSHTTISFKLHVYSPIFCSSIPAAVLNRFPVWDQYKCQAKMYEYWAMCSHLFCSVGVPPFYFRLFLLLCILHTSFLSLLYSLQFSVIHRTGAIGKFECIYGTEMVITTWISIYSDMIVVHRERNRNKKKSEHENSLPKCAYISISFRIQGGYETVFVCA